VQTIFSALQWWQKSRADVTALSLGEDRISYGDWVPWIERVAAQLLDMGVERGDRINACGANSLEYCTLAMAAMRAGAIIAPLNSRFTGHELCEIVEDHGPRLIFAGEEQVAKFAGTEVPIHDFSEIAALRTGDPASVACDLYPDDCVLIISTSGSTAKPKGVMFSHRTMTAYAMANAVEDGALRDGGGVIVVAPLATSAGMVQLVHYSVLGCTLYFEPLFDAERFLDILIEEPIVSFAGAPAFFERIGALPRFADGDLSSLKSVYAGGARVTRGLYDLWATKGLHIRQTYGQTEAQRSTPSNLPRAIPKNAVGAGCSRIIKSWAKTAWNCRPMLKARYSFRGPR
jgi:fatty-acyl-CoA synthase